MTLFCSWLLYAAKAECWISHLYGIQEDPGYSPENDTKQRDDTTTHSFNSHLLNLGVPQGVCHDVMNSGAPQTWTLANVECIYLNLL